METGLCTLIMKPVLEAHPEFQYVQGVDINMVDGNWGQTSQFCGLLVLGSLTKEYQRIL